ncbi:MAG: hypothetical protein ACFNM6_06990, partial [Prevotella sp.]
LTRWAMERMVISPLSFKIVWVMLSSVALSKEDVASSKMRTSGMDEQTLHLTFICSGRAFLQHKSLITCHEAGGFTVQ